MDEREQLREDVLAATRALVGIAARSLAEVSDDVSLAQYRVLVLLEGRGVLTMGDLAASLDVHASTVTRMCDVLVEKKLIVRRPDDENRRSVYAVLAPRGRRLVTRVMGRRRALIDAALDRMTPAAQRRLARGLTEFAAVTDEAAGRAWTLGWSFDRGDVEASARVRSKI